MEAMLFNDQVGFMSPTRPSATCDSSRLWLGLSSDCKNFVKKEDFDFTDLLHSPDFNITSPNVESLFLKSLESPPALKAACLSSAFQLQDSCRRETCVTALQAAVTEEQEIFAQGFTDALEKLQRREEATKDDGDTTQQVEDPPDENQEDNIDNTRYCFISYHFESSKPLPSFREAFNSFVEFSAEKRPLRRVGHEIMADPSPDCVSWDKIETLDEGFSVLTGSMERLTSPDSCEDDSDNSLGSPTHQGPDDEMFDLPTGMDQNVLISCSSNVDTVEWTSNRYSTGDLAKQWPTQQTQNDLAKPTSVGFDFQAFKIEREKQSDYLEGYRQGEESPQEYLDTEVQLLYTENVRLQRQLDKLKRKRQRLQNAFNTKHSDGGQMQVQCKQTGISIHDKEAVCRATISW